jgi:hypothetical protein
MENEKIVTYSLLAHVNNVGTLSRDLIDIFVPLAKRALSMMCREGLNRGKSTVEIKNYVDSLYKLDIPLPVLRNVLRRIANELNTKEKTVFQLYEVDGSFQIQDYIFEDYEAVVQQKQNEVDRIEELFREFCNANKITEYEITGVFDFIDRNKLTLAKYLGIKPPKVEKEDFIVEAQFVEYFKAFPVIFNSIKNIYLGSIISSYLEFEPQNVSLKIELVLDTNFVISLLDLNTQESTHTCGKLVDLAKRLGYSLSVLDITVEECRRLLHYKIQDFDKAFLIKKIDPEDIYNACDRKGISRTDLERISQQLEELLSEKDITLIPNTTKYRKLARYSDQYEMLCKLRNTPFAALHDTTAYEYVKDKRGKPISQFDKVNCWFVNNSSTILHGASQEYEFKFQPESIKAEDLLNILWLSTPRVRSTIDFSELSSIGLSRLVSITLSETLPAGYIIRDLDENIRKYAREKISEQDVVRIASSIARRTMANVDELNKIAQKDEAEFVRRLQEISKAQKEFEEQQKRTIKDALERVDATSKKLEEERERYAAKRNELISKDQNEGWQSREKIKVLRSNVELMIEEKIKEAVFRWRLKSWIECCVFFIVFLAGALYILNISDWELGEASRRIKEIESNSIYSLAFSVLGFVFTIVFLQHLLRKYREPDFISAYEERVKKRVRMKLKNEP